MVYGIPTSINTLIDGNGNSCSYIANSSGSTSWEYNFGFGKVTQYGNVNAQLVNIAYISSSKVYISLFVFSSASGELNPGNGSISYSYTISINGMQKIGPIDGGSEIGLDTGNNSRYTTLNITYDNTIPISNIFIDLFVSGVYSGGSANTALYFSLNSPYQLGSNSLVICNNNINYPYELDIYTNYTVNKHISLPTTPIPNMIYHIKATTIPVRVYSYNIPIDRSALSANMGGNTINGFILRPWASITLAYNSSLNSWFIHSYFDGNPTDTNVGLMTIPGGIATTTLTGNTAIIVADLFNTAKTVRLPSPTISGTILTIIYDGTKNTNNLYIDPNGSKIDNSTSAIFIRPVNGNFNGAIRLVSGNSQWYILDIFNAPSTYFAIAGTQTSPSDTSRNLSNNSSIVYITTATTSSTSVTVNMPQTTEFTGGLIRFIKDTNTVTPKYSLVLNSANGYLCGVADRVTVYNSTSKSRSALITASYNNRHYVIGSYLGY